jgi:ribosomal protein S18 acetylase RimI-like enzyme
MLGRVTHPPILAVLEGYYDAAPRPAATTEEVGPFTLFVRRDPSGWPFYARPRLGLDVPFTAADVQRVRVRQREVGAPEALEWVLETTPSLLDAARADGLHVAECPLLAFPADPSSLQGQVSRCDSQELTTQVLEPDSPDLPAVIGAVEAGFTGTDDVEPGDPGGRLNLMRAGLLVTVAAYDERGDIVGGGSHSPRGSTTELTGIAVVPRARRRGAGAAITRALVEDAQRRGVQTVFLSAQDDTVARVYERVGFTRVGTACIAEAPDA